VIPIKANKREAREKVEIMIGQLMMRYLTVSSDALVESACQITLFKVI